MSAIQIFSMNQYTRHNRSSFASKNLLVALLFLIFISHVANAQVSLNARLRTGDISLAPNLRQDLIDRELDLGKTNSYYYSVIAFDRLPNPKALNYLRQSGVELLEKISDNIFTVRFKQKPAILMLKTSGIKAIKSMPPGLKTSTALSVHVANAQNDANVKVSVLFYREENSLVQLAFAEAQGFNVTSRQYADQGLFIGTISTKQIYKLAALPFVRGVNLFDYKIEPLLQTENGVFALTSLKGNQLSARNLSGKNVVVAVGDDADPTSHIDLIADVENRNPTPPQFSNHGTRVSGIVSGDGLLEENFTGIAPDVKVIADFYDFVLAKTPIYKKDFGMTITNNSYYNGYIGCPGNGAYNELSVFADQQIWQDSLLMHVFAAGNDGRRTCANYPLSYGTIKSGYQVAKNVLSVGDYYIYNPPAIYETSSRGPVNDGRLKPEIVAPGGNFWSTGINNTYNNGFGTSFASPLVAGVYALLAERYQQLHNNKIPSAVLMKAILCNTASDKGNNGPDFLHGFGLIHPVRALYAIEDNRFVKGSVNQGGQFNYNLSIPQGTKRVKVMLYWNDPAGSPMAQTMLQHDLDLQLTDNSQTYLPWILNSAPNQVSAPATRGIDRLNNIEQVTIDNPVGGNVQIQVNGYAVMNGAQDFYITWDFYSDDVTLIYPIGGEKFTPGLNIPYEGITWDAPENINDSLTIEYSINNGSSWTLIASNIPANRFWHLWTMPNISVSNAKIRLTRKSNNAVTVTPGSFTIMRRPTVTSAVPCEGAVNLSWAAINNVTDYEVFQLNNYKWQKVGTTSSLQYQVRGLDRSTRYWFAVRCRVADSVGRRSRGIAVTPSLSTPCTSSEFDNDLKIDQIVSPVHGRKHTSTELTTAQEVIVKIKNLDNAPTAGSYNVSYQVNNGTIVTEQSSIVIPASGTIDYAFTTTADLSSVDSFYIKTFVKQAGDQRPENDSMMVLVKHLDNLPVSLPHIEDFENTDEAVYRTSFFGLNKIDRFDYNLNTTNGRARTFVNSGMAPSGNRAITLDAAQYLGAVNINQLVGTYNFSNVPQGEDLRLDFQFKNQGQLNLPSGILWIRGNDDSPWIKAYELTNDRNLLGIVRNGWVNVKEILLASGQSLSTSFQIFFQQSGRASANNGDYYTALFDLDDGITIDNIRFSKANNDLMLIKIESPDSLMCASGNFSQSVSLKVKNLSSNALTNIPVFYKLGTNAPVQETIPVIAGNTEINYTFLTPLSLAGSGKYKLDAWVSLPTDDYAVNDSIIGHEIFLNESITNFPYLEKFENDDAGWFKSNAYSSWSWGTTDSLTRSVIKTAANGNKAWFTALSGAYNSNEFSYLYTPCFNISALASPVLSFSHIYRQQRAADIHLLEYSTDNGNSWQRLGVQNTGTNWYDTTANFWNRDIQRWHVSSADLPVGVSNIRFRFLFTSDDFTQFDGVGIDDFHVFDKATIYEGQNTTVSKQVSGNDYIHFFASNNIIASINPMGQNLGDVQVGVFINKDTVRLLNNQYYLDRNIVVNAQNEPTDSVMIRFYFSENDIVRMLTTTKCSPCIKLNDAYRTSVTQYSGLPEYENGILNDGFGGAYQFIDATKVEVVPFNNGYYAAFKVKSFSEFWIHANNFNLSQVPLSVNDVSGSRNFINNTLINAAGQLIINPADQRGVQEINIRLMNAGGQEIMNVSKPYQRTILDVGSIAHGVYFISVVDKSGKYIYRSKLVK